jgi:hypothetical protein
MVKRWMASALLATETNFRKIMSYRDLWTLDAILNGSKSVTLTFNEARVTFWISTNPNRNITQFGKN